MTEEYHTVDCDRACHGTCRMTATPAVTPAPTKWEADHMGLCDHGINHRGERHGCDGCCDASVDAPVKHDHEECHRILKAAIFSSEWRGTSIEMASMEIDRLRAAVAAANKLADDNRQRHAASSEKYGRTFKALLDTRSELDAANAEITRLKAQAEETSKSLTVMDVITQERDEARAKLGAAVAALQDINPAWLDAGYAPHQRAIDGRNAIIADADGTQAAAAYIRLVQALGRLYRGEWATNEERDQLIDEAWAVVNRTVCVSCGMPGTVTCKGCGGKCAALAAVDARRGAK